MQSRMIYLLRPGKDCRTSGVRQYIGQYDVPLSAAGTKQIGEICELMKDIKLSAVYCSDLSRARDTAEIIAGSQGIVIHPRKELREISFGVWEGRSFMEIARRFPREFKILREGKGYCRFPGGESFADCCKRVTASFYSILQESTGHIVIIGHAGINRVLLSHLMGISLANLFRISQDYACINIIEHNHVGEKVKMLNYGCFPAQVVSD